MSCKLCGSTQLINDRSSGQTVCQNCGMVISEGSIVQDIQFEEVAGGASRLVGQFLSDSSLKVTAGSGGKSSFNSSSFDETVKRANNRIVWMSSRLNIPNYISERAVRIYTLALQHRATRGTPANTFCAACLYMATRMEKAPNILLDFANIIRVNMFKIGSAYLRLVRLLRQTEIDQIDPCIYLHRFAFQLQLGKKKTPVIRTAIRIIGSMNRDWISVGRKPLGLCGAALVIACRVHDQPRTVQEVADTVHVATSTIQKRLDDFKRTAAAKLTVTEFAAADPQRIPEAEAPAYAQRSKSAIERSVRQIIRDAAELYGGGEDEEEEEEEAARAREKVAVLAVPSAEELGVGEKEVASFLCDTELAQAREQLWEFQHKSEYEALVQKRLESEKAERREPPKAKKQPVVQAVSEESELEELPPEVASPVLEEEWSDEDEVAYEREFETLFQ
eukprot:gnl/Chilomastix_cuspidata/4602.p1 GENE.gnl/Chilomastix_cuspidata/4602~~gnl/Chilomastix_cuspidata/4602.p1  ORF type:complete len:448 (-),score=185.97 gnl/Chilomastix_cuspidata/4602:38-1381(-)